MNDTRFKELLNLYLDHRLSAEEASELETMLQREPALRRRLRSYEVMHKGCAELFQRSASDAPAPDALVLALRQAEDRMRAKSERRAAVHGWATWGTAAGATALVALMVARVSQPSLSTDSPASIDTAARQNAAVEQSFTVATNSAAATSPQSAGPVARRRLPEHLTLAALGIAPEPRRAGSDLGTWSSGSETNGGRLAVAQADSAEWMAVSRNSTPTQWPPASVSTAAFSGRPISGWGQTNSGFQVQTAGFTFER